MELVSLYITRHARTQFRSRWKEYFGFVARKPEQKLRGLLEQAVEGPSPILTEEQQETLHGGVSQFFFAKGLYFVVAHREVIAVYMQEDVNTRRALKKVSRGRKVKKPKWN